MRTTKTSSRLKFTIHSRPNWILAALLLSLSAVLIVFILRMGSFPASFAQVVLLVFALWNAGYTAREIFHYNSLEFLKDELVIRGSMLRKRKVETYILHKISEPQWVKSTQNGLGLMEPSRIRFLYMGEEIEAADNISRAEFDTMMTLVRGRHLDLTKKWTHSLIETPVPDYIPVLGLN